MNEIKQYKPLALVFYINGKWERDILPLDEDKRWAFKKAIEANKMVELGWITINVFDIKEIRPASTLTKLENIFYSIPRAERKYIELRTKKIAGEKIDVIEFRSNTSLEKAVDRWEMIINHYHEEVLWDKPKSNETN